MIDQLDQASYITPDDVADGMAVLAIISVFSAGIFFGLVAGILIGINI